MISILSPAKKMDFSSVDKKLEMTEPVFQSEAVMIMKELKKLPQSKLTKLMNLSNSLSDEVFNSIQHWGEEGNPQKQAVMTYCGEAFKGLNTASFSEHDFKYAHGQLLILSGLYGILQPCDLVEAYRLEMGLNWKLKKQTNLYHFWRKKITDRINTLLIKQENKFLLNLASAEYYKVIDRKELRAEIIDVQFKDWKNGEYKTIMTFAKQARGAMAGEIIRNKIDHPSELWDLKFNDYCVDIKESTDLSFIFKRKQ